MRYRDMAGKILLLLLICLTAMLPTMAAERVTYYHADALGSPVAATDAQGQVLWREAYTPWGERVRREGGGQAQWYSGKPYETSLGLSYQGARWYDVRMGRFMSVDPAGYREAEVQSFNRYAYGNNSPYHYVDPDGKIAVPAIIIGALWLSYRAAGTAYDAYDTYQVWTDPQSSDADRALAMGLLAAGVVEPTGALRAGKTAVRVTKEVGKGVTKKADDVVPKRSRRPNAETRRQADQAATDSQGNARCQYCGEKVTDKAGSPASKEYDHIDPYSRGGDSSIDNINVSCRTCNRSKGAKTADEWQGGNR